MSSRHPQSDPSRLQSGSVHRPRRRRLLHRHLDVRVVSGRADPPLARSGELAAAHASAQTAEPAEHARAIRTRAASGRPISRYADGRFYLVYTDVKRYGRTTVAGASGASLRDFHNYLVTSTDIDGDWSDPDLSQQQRLRSVALPRRRRAEVPAEHAVGSPSRAEPLRRHRHAGVLARGAAAGRGTARHLLRHAARSDRRSASLQARRLLPFDHRGGGHRLGPRGDHGARDGRSTGPTSCIPTSTC